MAKNMKVAVKTKNGMPVWLPDDQEEAFRKGQELSAKGKRPENAEQKESELLSLLLEKAGL